MTGSTFGDIGDADCIAATTRLCVTRPENGIPTWTHSQILNSFSTFRGRGIEGFRFWIVSSGTRSSGM